MCCNITIRVWDSPFEFLEIQFFLDFGDEGHLGFWYYEIWNRFKSKDLENGLVLTIEYHSGKEYWIFGWFGSSLLIIQGGKILIFLFKLITKLTTITSKINDQIIRPRILHSKLIIIISREWHNTFTRFRSLFKFT